MRRFTTPTLRITLKRKVGEDEKGNPIYEVADDLVFDYLIFTLKAQGKRVDKRIEYGELEAGVFTVRFTQEETGGLTNLNARAEINFFSGEDVRLATLIKSINVAENLIDEVIHNG